MSDSEALSPEEIRDAFYEATLEELAEAESRIAIHAVSVRARVRMEGFVEGTETREKACRKGCSLCCHFRVELRPDELFSLAAHCLSEFSPALLETVRSASAAYAKRIAGLAPEEHARLNLPCPLLGPDGSCRSYATRPETCRIHHSFSLSACEKIHANPTDLSATVPHSEEERAAMRIAQIGIREAYDTAGLSTTPLALGARLHEVLTEDGLREREARWFNRQEPFPND